MKQILVFGAGKSSTVLIEDLIQQAQKYSWKIIVADHDLQLARSKVKDAPGTEAIGMDITDTVKRDQLIERADLVISLLPPALHLLIAQSCISSGKNLLTASYIDKDIRALQTEIERKGLLFLCEMGLDPGIDHMSAMQLIDDIQKSGGKIRSFHSHCGGLVAPESDDNPWHYKISWNPRNVVMAGRSGAEYLEKGVVCQEPYESLFNPARLVNIPGLGELSWYPNRDSLSYIDLYKLQGVETFVRTTLRHPEFCLGWKNIIELRLTDDTLFYETDGMTLKDFFQQHLEACGFSDWIKTNFTARFEDTRELLEKLNELIVAEKTANDDAKALLQEMMMVNSSGDLEKVSLDDVKEKAARTVAGQMQEANVSLHQLIFLGMNDAQTFINKGRFSAADVLQFILEQKLPLKPSDKDMIVMLHQIRFDQQDVSCLVESSMVIKGEDNVHTAMAKTVGMPLAIAARLILNGELNIKGLHIPIIPEIYQPVLKALEESGIRFEEKILPG